MIHFQSRAIFLFRCSATPQRTLLQCHLQFLDVSKLRSRFENDILSDIFAVNFRNVLKIWSNIWAFLKIVKAFQNFISFHKLIWRHIIVPKIRRLDEQVLGLQTKKNLIFWHTWTFYCNRIKFFQLSDCDDVLDVWLEETPFCSFAKW